jgi:hypothetical protein
MSFLEELEDSKKEQAETDKQPRDLWEGCFKYFKHFVSILTKNKKEFDSNFNLIFLDTIKKCKVIGPYDISRTQNNNILKLEVKMLTQLVDLVKIDRKDKRSAELLQSKLSKDGILSSVKVEANNQIFVEINRNIPSILRIILKDDKDFHIEYRNVCSSSNRSINMKTSQINEKTMDQIAKYILGQNPDLYTESISDHEITKIRRKIELSKLKQKDREAEIQAEIKKNEELEAIRKANTLKEKSKKYFSDQSNKFKDKLINKIKNLKSKR